MEGSFTTAQNLTDTTARRLLKILEVTMERSVTAAEKIYAAHAQAIMSYVETVSPATLGEIISTGLAFQDDECRTRHCLYVVHCDDWGAGKYASGREHLNILAATTLVARMADLLPQKP